MKNILLLTGAAIATTLSAQAITLTFTGANAQGATVDSGLLASISEPATNSTLTSLSYTVSGLTIDGDGSNNDTVTFTFAVSPTGGSGPITWDQNDGGIREFDYNTGTFGGGEGITFGAITVSGTSSSGAAYTLSSASYTEVTARRWGSGDSLTIAGDVTNTTITHPVGPEVSLNDTSFTATATGGTWNLTDVDFSVTVIPEPGTFALLAGLTGLVFVMLRRRKV